MIVIPPISITPAMVTSSVSEPDAFTNEIAWVSGTDYPVGTICALPSTHRRYTRVIAGISTIPPDLDLTTWEESGLTNKYAMFDLYNTTGTYFSTSISVDIAFPSRINTIVLMGLNLQEVVVTVTSGASEVYNSTNSLVTRNVVDYFDYFFEEFIFQNALLLKNIPPILGGVLHITSATGGSITSVIMGNTEYIGFTQQGHSNDALNFSINERDEFGNTILVPRRSVPKTTQSLVVKKSDVSRVLSIRESLNAVPAVWAGLDNSSEAYFDSLLILGIYKEFSLSLDYPEFAMCTLELEEL